MGTVRGVQVSVCTWGNVSESRKWKCGVLPLKKLFSFCVQEWEKLEAVFFLFLFILYFFPNPDHPVSRVLQLLSTHMMCSFSVAPKVGKTCLAAHEHHKHLLIQTESTYSVLSTSPCKAYIKRALRPFNISVLLHCRWAVSQRIDTAEPQI